MNPHLHESVSPETKRQIIQRQLNIWHNTLYEADLNLTVAQIIGSPDLQEQSTLAIAAAQKAIAELTTLQSQLNPTNTH